MPTPAHRDTRLTYEDFVRVPDDGMRHEIIGGVHDVTHAGDTGLEVLIGRVGCTPTAPDAERSADEPEVTGCPSDS
jgi:hypothetical protein